MRKRYPYPKAKAGELLVKYGQVNGERDLFYCIPDNKVGMRTDRNLLNHVFENIILFPDSFGKGKTLRKELEERGYDITTFKFSIMKKQDPEHTGEKQ